MSLAAPSLLSFWAISGPFAAPYAAAGVCRSPSATSRVRRFDRLGGLLRTVSEKCDGMGLKYAVGPLSVRQVPALFRREVGMCGNRDKQLGEEEPSRRLVVSTVSGLCFRRFDFVRAAFRFFAASERGRRMKRLRVRVANANASDAPGLSEKTGRAERGGRGA